MGYETEIVQPAAASLARQRGYKCQREVILPNGRRADIIAFKDDRILIIECKRDCRHFNRTIDQVDDYARWYKDAQRAIAVPRQTITRQASRLAIESGIMLIPVSVGPPIHRTRRYIWRSVRWPLLYTIALVALLAIWTAHTEIDFDANVIVLMIMLTVGRVVARFA